MEKTELRTVALNAIVRAELPTGEASFVGDLVDHLCTSRRSSIFA